MDFKKIIPNFIRLQFTNRPMLQKVIKNIGWLSIDRFIQLLVSLFVGIWVARYLGPSDYGIMSFAIAFGALFTPLVGMGIKRVLNRELIKNPNKHNMLLGTSFYINLVTAVISVILIILSTIIIHPNDSVVLLVIFLFSLSNIVNSFSVIDRYFESKIEIGKTVRARTVGLMISSLLKILFILSGKGIIFIIFATLIEAGVRTVSIIYYYFKEGKSIFKWRFSKKLAKNLLTLSWPLMFSAIFVVIYLHIDQVMLGLILGDYEVGLYSVAAKISTIFYFLPGAIAVSLFPTLMTIRKNKLIYFKRLQKMSDFFMWFPLIIIVPIFLLSNFIIVLLYGLEFAPAGITLSILIWALLAIFLRSATENYINAEALYKFSLVFSLIGAIINIILNIILIPVYGINGAAIATVISYFSVGFFSNFLFKQTRPLFYMQLKSLNLWRIINEFKICFRKCKKV